MSERRILRNRRALARAVAMPPEAVEEQQDIDEAAAAVSDIMLRMLPDTNALVEAFCRLAEARVKTTASLVEDDHRHDISEFGRDDCSDELCWRGLLCNDCARHAYYQFEDESYFGEDHGPGSDFSYDSVPRAGSDNRQPMLMFKSTLGCKPHRGVLISELLGDVEGPHFAGRKWRSPETPAARCVGWLEPALTAITLWQSESFMRGQAPVLLDSDDPCGQSDCDGLCGTGA